MKVIKPSQDTKIESVLHSAPFFLNKLGDYIITLDITNKKQKCISRTTFCQFFFSDHIHKNYSKYTEQLFFSKILSLWIIKLLPLPIYICMQVDRHWTIIIIWLIINYHTCFFFLPESPCFSSMNQFWLIKFFCVTNFSLLPDLILLLFGCCWVTVVIL